MYSRSMESAWKGGDTLSVWEVRPGRGLKKRLALVSMRNYQG